MISWRNIANYYCNHISAITRHMHTPPMKPCLTYPSPTWLNSTHMPVSPPQRCATAIIPQHSCTIPSTTDNHACRHFWHSLTHVETVGWSRSTRIQSTLSLTSSSFISPPPKLLAIKASSLLHQICHTGVGLAIVWKWRRAVGKASKNASSCVEENM